MDYIYISKEDMIQKIPTSPQVDVNTGLTPISLGDNKVMRYGNLEKPYLIGEKDYIKIPDKMKRESPNLGSKLLQSLGSYDQRYKQPITINTGVGQIDHISYYNPLDRSYIPWSWFPRVQRYNKSSGTQPYTHIRLNAPNVSHLLTDKVYDGLNIIQDKVQQMALKKAKSLILTKINNIVNKGRINPVLNPLQYSYKGDGRTVQPVTLFRGNPTNEDTYVINDPLSYQVQSYKQFIYKYNDSTNKYEKNTLHENVSNDIQYTDGNIIKFWIQDLNNKTMLTTPAFFSSLQDSGLDGQWQQFNYVGGMYPKFSYKGQSKRSISFQLKLGCFDKRYLKQYVQKLNFFRLVGSPTWQTINIGSNDNKFDFQFPKAPIYKITLGDIVNEVYGYFEKCEISWGQQQMSWNLIKENLYNNDKISEWIQEQDIIHKTEIPIISTIDITFVCMYGRGLSNKIGTNFENWVYRPNIGQESK